MDCEAGDLSGKNGNMMGSGSSGLRFVGSYLGDPVPPIAKNYLQSDQVSTAWASIVFHKPSAYPAFLCAKMMPIVYSPSVAPTALPSPLPTVIPTPTPTLLPTTAPTVGPTSYRAHFTPAESSGAQGYFDMMIDSNGMATYKWNLNLNYYTLSTSLIAAGCTDANFIAQNGLKCKFDFCL